jgi:hypothetical protein
MRAASEFDRRVGPGTALSAEAGAIAYACADMAARFHAGGKLVVFGNGAGATDAAHVAVEFVHPVIVGKRALPALSLSNDAAALTGLAENHGLAGIYAAQLALISDPGDIALGICGVWPRPGVWGCSPWRLPAVVGATREERAWPSPLIMCCGPNRTIPGSSRRSM